MEYDTLNNEYQRIIYQGKKRQLDFHFRDTYRLFEFGNITDTELQKRFLEFLSDNGLIKNTCEIKSVGSQSIEIMLKGEYFDDMIQPGDTPEDYEYYLSNQIEQFIIEKF